MRRTLTLAGAAVLAGSMLGLEAPAQAVPTAPAQAFSNVRQSAAHCVKQDVAKRKHVPDWRLFRDTKPISRADLAAVAPVRNRFEARTVSEALPPVVNIPVYVHVIKGRHRAERGPGPRRVRQLIGILNGGYAGLQSPASVPTRYHFNLKKIDYKKNDRWYHAYGMGPRDRQAKRRLHRGGKRTLNLFINGGGSRTFPILGWSRLPWQQASSPRLDSVSVNVASMPGGVATNYNLGDTVIHETGHWLGLFHPFQGGCSEPNDQVADTPAEAGPSYYCNTAFDSCPSLPGIDDVHNFMDYSFDSCLNEFTAGQVARMDSAWATWRQ